MAVAMPEGSETDRDVRWRIRPTWIAAAVAIVLLGAALIALLMPSGSPSEAAQAGTSLIYYVIIPHLMLWVLAIILVGYWFARGRRAGNLRRRRDGN